MNLLILIIGCSTSCLIGFAGGYALRKTEEILENENTNR